MSRTQRRCHLSTNIQHFVKAERFVNEMLGQRLTLDKFRDDEVVFVLVPDFIDREHVGWVKLEAAKASRSKRRTRFLLLVTPPLRTLIATRRCKLRPSAR